jgi:hypothetical protein
MKPQPPAISHLIIKRLKKRELRHSKRTQLESDMEDLDIERKFEEGLQRLTGVEFPKIYSSPEAKIEWGAYSVPVIFCLQLLIDIVILEQPIVASLDNIRIAQTHEYARAAQKFSPELMETIIEARREKIRNKTREKERERRGELTKSAIKRQRKGPPAHILAKMTPKEREMDKISRSLSEVGYVAVVKERLGFKLKNPETALELGQKDNQPLLDQATTLIRAENRRRGKEMREAIKSSSPAQPEDI